MFGFKSKKADVLSHWYTPVPSFSISTKEFYVAIEEELKEQKVPGLELSRVEFSEGGLLSDKREYLRMTRERLVFDICACPFGINYFFSCRFAELPAKVNILALAIVFITFMFALYFSLRIIGFWQSLLLWPIGLVILVYMLRNAVSLGLQDVDAWLMKQPLFGPLYERFFRAETYYREDTRLMYLTVVEGVVKKLVEEETAAKGVRLLTQYEYAPILRDLYKPRPLASPIKQETEEPRNGLD
jgi:hypothetical protein